MQRKPLLILTACLLLFVLTGRAQEPKPQLGQERAAQNDALLKDSGWKLYIFNLPGILQGHLAFQSPYSGVNSLQKDYEQEYSVTSTLFFGRKSIARRGHLFQPRK